MGLEAYLKDNGFFTTQVNAIIAWARKSSVWPMPMGISCCAIEMMAVGDPKYDIARFGSEVMRFTPRQCDLDDCCRYCYIQNGSGCQKNL